jgi:hypothetical protein
MPKQAHLHHVFVTAVLFLICVEVASAQCTSSSTDPYLDCAKQSYQALQTDIGSSSNYWQIGNVADSMFDFLAMLSPTDFDQYNSIQGNTSGCTGTLPLAQYLACRYPAWMQLQSGCWYDDYGWWGIASSKAFDTNPSYERIFANPPGTKAMFQNIAWTTWNIMNTGKDDGIHNGAPKVWENRDNLIGFTPPRPTPVPGQLNPPRFQGGVWQYDLFTNARSSRWDGLVKGWAGPVECSGSTMNPKTTALGPYQDTVVNSLYFTLAQRLLAAGPSRPANYETAVNDMYGFLRNWFGYDESFMVPTQPGGTCPAGCDNDKALLQLYPPPQQGGTTGSPALVYERASTYDTVPGLPYPPVENWSPKTFWAGDQGLMLGGLIDFARTHPHDKMGPEVAQMIVKGVMTKMVGSDGGVLPWLPGNGNAPGNDPGDYDSGSGIFMRYLLYADKVQLSGNPIPALVASKEFQTFLKNAADAAYCHYNNDFNNPMFGHFNTLATMVAARQLLASPPSAVTCQ